MSEQEQGNIPPKATPAAPGAPRPITVRLKPITPAGAPPPPAAAPDAAAAPAPEAEPAAAEPAPTVKLRPVVLTPVTPPAPVAPPAPVTPPASPSATSPIPASAQVQASKSKTSRISLDSAIGAPTSIPIKPAEAGAPKTIRLKRPSDLSAPMTPVAPIAPPTAKSGTAPIRQTSRIPDSVLSDVGADATVTQKKTLKIKRPGVEAPDAAADTSLDGIQMMPISQIEGNTVPQSSKAFTVTAIVLGSVAAVLLIALTWCLASDALGPASGSPPAADIFWPGKFGH